MFISDPNQNIDYSQFNIVYEFMENNILTVLGKVGYTDNRIHEIGNHF